MIARGFIARGCLRRCSQRAGAACVYSASLPRPESPAIGSIARRLMAVYAVGDGWTGALGQAMTTERIPGHRDTSDDRNLEPFRENPPRKIYDGAVAQAAVGWCHTAIIDAETSKLMVIGRPQEFQSMLRINRLPSSLRDWIASKINTSRQDEHHSFVSTIINFASGSDANHPAQQGVTWDDAKAQSFIPRWSEIVVGTESRGVSKVAASAGLTALVGQSGMLYTFGLNNRGQCGVGAVSNNVWSPRHVQGLKSKKSLEVHEEVSDQEEAIIDVSLGLQHGVALSVRGRVYSWGKAGRGQLGREINSDQAESAGLVWKEDAVQIASGMHHGALLTDDNEVYLWGKNMLMPQPPSHDNDAAAADDAVSEATVATGDALVPQRVRNLPDCKVLQISCGSHHLAVLMENGSVYGLGIAADIHDQPLLSEPVELIPAGALDMPYRQFEAHQDRTTVVDRSGRVHQAHLWKDKSLQAYSMFTPGWSEVLTEQGEDIQSVHRSWLHTVIVTKPRS